jgi:hypothetical protein
MQSRSFFKRQLAAILLMLDEEEKNTSLGDKEACVGSELFQNQKFRMRILDF